MANYIAICRRRVDYARLLRMAKILTKPKLNPCEHELTIKTTESLRSQFECRFCCYDTKKSDNKNEPVLLPQAGLKSKNRAKLLVTELKYVRGQTQIRRVFYTEDP